MLNRVFGHKTHDYINHLAVFSLAVGLIVSKVVMSMATMLLLLNFLLNADFKGAWQRIRKNYVFWFIFFVFVMHFLGLTYTSDFDYALSDLKTKLPLFVIPVVMIAYPIQQNFLKYVFYGFILTLLITSFVNYSFMLDSKMADYRSFSLFGSHIRYALLIVTGAAISVYFMVKNKMWIFLPVLLWFIFYTVVSQVFSGYIALLLVMVGCLIYGVSTLKNQRNKWIVSLGAIAVCLVSGVYVYKYFMPEKEDFNFSELPTHSAHGEGYYIDTTSLWFENQHHVLSGIASSELRTAWNKRSEIDYEAELEEAYPLNAILIRYMTSKGLTKDKEGMKKMSEKDIENVENGIASVRYTYGTFRFQVSELKNQLFHYKMGGDPDGNSLLQRFEHWKAGRQIIKENYLLGVGTGDVQQAFDKVYQTSNTQLDKQHWNRAHNQFMTFWISFGIVGFMVFLGFWLWFLWQNIKIKNLIGICFTLISMGSFLSEDTIETQQGVTYIALFLGIISLINVWMFSEKKEEV